MDNELSTPGNSILDQIIKNHQAEEVANLDVVEIIDRLFNELSTRERDILTRRHGLHGQGKETLENIGQIHSLTRERIRQIETSGLKKLRQLERLEDYIASLKKIIINLLEEHGGLMEREYLLNLLVNFSVGGGRQRASELEVHMNYLDFLISELLHNDFEIIEGHEHFKHSYKLKHSGIEHLEAVAKELVEAVAKAEKIFSTDEIIAVVRELASYREHEEKIVQESNIDLRSALPEHFDDAERELINDHKSLFSLVRAARHIERNKFGHWGVASWRVVKPKTINDKIYLILKNHGQPLHFGDIAVKINEIGFDGKKANAATVHNELILDEKYVLVGRGLYGLKEWGYNRGTVADVIKDILAEAGTPLTRDQIIDRVLAKRLVKKSTVVLALMNKSLFERKDGKYDTVKQ